MATPTEREHPHRVQLLRELGETSLDPVSDREAVCRDLRERGHDEFADYLGRLPERTYRSVVADALDRTPQNR